MKGTEIVYGDLLLDRGLVRGIGEIPKSYILQATNLTVVDANGAWVTPGLGKIIRILIATSGRNSSSHLQWTCTHISVSTVRPACQVHYTVSFYV
jgi:hypothetical protein